MYRTVPLTVLVVHTVQRRNRSALNCAGPLNGFIVVAVEMSPIAW